MIRTDFSDVKGKVCVITGGAGILGQAICEALAAHGVKTAILGRTTETIQALARRLSRQYHTPCIGVQADVLQESSLVAARELVTGQLGDIDYLINGAGGNAPEATTRLEQIISPDDFRMEDSFFGLDLAGFDKVFALNFSGTVLPTRIFGLDMVRRKKGVILNISSMNSFRPLTKIPAYSAAKASVNNFTQWLAVHLARTGVRVNAIAPGFFLTHQNRFLLIDEKTGEPTERGRKIIGNTPVGRYGQPEDLQGAVLFLLSDSASFITGVVLPVDGGYSAYGGV
jgi:NAD(P)-dependent dehydrogenase (short-subunit alcohol dehydrogenase family)